MITQIDFLIDKWAIKSFGVAVAGSPKMIELKQKLNAIAILKDTIQEHYFKGFKEPMIIEKGDWIPKEVLKEKIDKLFTFMDGDVSDKKITISKQQLIKELLNEEEKT